MIFEIIESGSIGNCYLIKNGDQRLLIDPGISFDKIAKYLGYNFFNLAVLISHSHSDHCKAIKDLVKRGIKCYCRKETKKELNMASHNIVEIPLKYKCLIQGLEVTAFNLPHSIPTCGFFVNSFPEQKRLVYAIDCQTIPYRFAAETICVECNYDKLLLDPLLKNTNIWHMEIEETKKFLAESVDKFTKEIVLLHISQRHGDKERFVNEIQEIYPNCKVRAN